LRLCAFARQKTNNSHQSAKGFSNFFAAFLLGEKKKKLARKACLPQAGREDAKGFSLHPKN
jgi:hypothetical protein